MVHRAGPARSPRIPYLKWWLMLPGVALVGAYLWLKRLFKGTQTEGEQRQAEKARQREIRRELRGLAPEESSTKRS